MIIPKKLKIGGHIYSVEWTKPKDTERRKGNWGITLLEEKRILIDREMPQSQKEETFIHELLHCCFHQASLNYDIDDKVELTEEQVVSRLANVLHQVLVDNKLLK